MSELTQSAAWRALQEHARNLQSTRTTDLFSADPRRAERFSAEGAGISLDYSKQRITPETLDLLQALARQQGLEKWRERLFGGEPINDTEHRAAAHVALRAPREAKAPVCGQDVAPLVHGVLDRLEAFASQVRSGAWTGYTGERITDVINIGIGGSDLGPRMACSALAAYADGPRLHFVSNVDGAQISALFGEVRPETTLWIVTSKTFTTQETMANAHAARRWFLQDAPESAIARHFVAVSTHQAAVREFGISTDNMFGFWDWVGGRYSLWSAVGLPIILAIGPLRFRELLAGAHAMDVHFRTASPERNLPILMALLAIWNNNFLGCASHCMAPYSQRLERFTAWLQQLEMESNGKGVDRAGNPVDYATTPVLWGDVGTNGQHAFFQMLHQGPAIHAIDFILPLQSEHELRDQHAMLVANCLAQSAALMTGKSAAEVREELVAKGYAGEVLEAAIPHRVFHGNRPSNTVTLPTIDPYHLGALLALYEHRTFVLSVIWNINPFDQWGVELGKQLAQRVLRAMAGGDAVALDPSTRRLLRRLD
ncbi:MAG: glucose-6-phosphate isomerase [Nevskiaceae bacterium]|nr:MAG: glucose-6-phosphate isomerase [Nevskiaceae bacterium]